jgi:short-subunit dehydrogenase
MRTLVGKRVFITGAGSGIGRALALGLAREGAHVALADVNAAAANAVARDIRQRKGTADVYALDVSDASQVARVRSEVAGGGRPVDVLVNNAGVVYGGAFLDVPLDRHLATYGVNTVGPVLLTHAFLPDLIARPEAHIVNIASASGLVGLPFGSTYASSKWAVVGFSESMRMELAQLGHRHVGVTTVCPSYVQTGMFDGVRAPRLTRLLTPDRVADLTVRAILANRAFVLTPWLVKVTPLLNAALPRPVFDLLARAFGVNTSMASWRGRGPG